MTLKDIARAAIVAAALGGFHAALAAAPATVTQPVNDRQTVTLAGNTHPEARLTNDRGALPAEFRLDHMMLLLKRPPATEAALTSFIDSQYDPASPNLHHWLTAAQLGETYGPAETDIAAVATWLTAHGFTVNGIATSRMTMDVSGTAAAVNSAFHTEMHRLNVAGVSHIANMSDPHIPAALSGVVAGVTSLNDFRPHMNFKPRPQYTGTPTGGTKHYAMVPADLAMIYNFNPAFAAGITGTGQTVVVIQDTNVYSTADWTKFRSEFGLSKYSSGSIKQVHPTGSNSCGNPGVIIGAQTAAIFEAEWASAAAPGATIEVASCASTATTFGALIALQNVINATSPPAIVSMSFATCERANGTTQNATYYATYQQAASEGISVFVSSGDIGAADCDDDQQAAQLGIYVNGLASTPYNVAVGGTDFGDTYSGKNATYWSSTNSSTYGSAKSYVPEIPWDDSCASGLIAHFNGYSESYGSKGFCNSATGEKLYPTNAAGGGGPSNCATGNITDPATCKGYAKPSWQKVRGNPADRARDIPDISLFAGTGVWNHFYIFCDSDPAYGTPCTGAPINWSIPGAAGGTSFTAPIMAGIQALVNEHQHEAQGNPNPVYYKLANAEYGTNGNANCNATLGNGISSACIFHDVDEGGMPVSCVGTFSCYRPSGTYGVLSTSDNSFESAYGSGLGWDFATGIGTVNVYNLVENW